jgi:hypothetical protein
MRTKLNKYVIQKNSHPLKNILYTFKLFFRFFSLRAVSFLSQHKFYQCYKFFVHLIGRQSFADPKIHYDDTFNLLLNLTKAISTKMKITNTKITEKMEQLVLIAFLLLLFKSKKKRKIRFPHICNCPIKERENTV